MQETYEARGSYLASCLRFQVSYYDTQAWEEKLWWGTNWDELEDEQHENPYYLAVLLML